MNKIFVIVGPTGAGKTELASRLAPLVRGEIVSADSRQVYKYLNVGTNKAGTYDKTTNRWYVHGIAQHLLDLIEPSDTFNAGIFVHAARGVIEELIRAQKTPIIVGGTGLYIKALIDGLAPMPEANPEIRHRLHESLKKHGKDYLYEKLKSVDSESAYKHRANPQRLIRALEVYEITGKPMSKIQKKTMPSPFTYLQFGVTWGRNELYKILDERCDTMLHAGMIEEAQYVLQQFSDACPGLQSIGYSHIVKYLKNELSKDGMRELFKRDMRRYAKRQITWFKKDNRITWFHLHNHSFSPQHIAEQIMKSAVNLI